MSDVLDDDDVGIAAVGAADAAAIGGAATMTGDADANDDGLDDDLRKFLSGS